ncbi:hypothetical protein MTR67_007226, partial [Solanum verrucosum]
MTSPKCRRLQLIHHSHPRGDWYPFEDDTDTCCFEIIAPYVEHLTISGGFNYTKIKLRDLSSLNHANLNLYCDEFAERDENIVKDFFGELIGISPDRDGWGNNLKNGVHYMTTTANVAACQYQVFAASFSCGSIQPCSYSSIIQLSHTFSKPLKYCDRGDDGNSESWLIENSPQIKAKIETECDETGLIDRISQLPDALIVQILSQLSITDAFRTTILCKHWQYVWTSIDVVYENEEFSHSDSSMLKDLSSLDHSKLDLCSDEFDSMDEDKLKDLLDHSFLQDEEYTKTLELYDLLSFEENIFKVFLQNLKNVKVMPFCSGTRTSEAAELDQFLKFLLEHAINLEKLVIVPKHKGCNSCFTNISQLMKCLLLSPRTSISTVISSGPVTQNVFDTLQLCLKLSCDYKDTRLGSDYNS